MTDLATLFRVQLRMLSEPSCLSETATRDSALRKLAQSMVHRWGLLSSFGAVFLIGIWAVVSIPSALFRGYHYVEGLTVTIAQSAIQDGNWLTPHLFNMRWIERPTLLSWVIAAVSYPFGHVYPFVARLPVILSILLGTLLVWWALQRIARAPAALFGAAAFLACPIVIRYYTTSVADIPLAVILFGAFLIWWNAFSGGRLTVWHWLQVGCLLAIAALLKGPQPLVYVVLGILAFSIVTRNWTQIPGLGLACVVAAIPVLYWYASVYVQGDQGEWMRYTRFASHERAWPHPFFNSIDFYLEVFPAAMLCTAFLAIGRKFVRPTVPQKFITALICYASAGTLVILFWPADVNPRYILPMTLPLCVLAGISYDALSDRMPAIAAVGICVVLGSLGYASQRSLMDAVSKPAYSRSKDVGGQITALIQAEPAPLYRTAWGVGLNELAYVPVRVTTIAPEAMASIPRPAWIVVPPDEGHKLIAQQGAKSRLLFGDTALIKLQ